MKRMSEKLAELFRSDTLNGMQKLKLSEIRCDAPLTKDMYPAIVREANRILKSDNEENFKARTVKPLSVTKQDGQYRLADGVCRYFAYKALQVFEINCVVLELTLDQCFQFNFDDVPYTACRAELIYRYMQSNQLRPEAVAELLCVSTEYVNALLSIRSPDVFDGEKLQAMSTGIRSAVTDYRKSGGSAQYQEQHLGGEVQICVRAFGSLPDPADVSRETNDENIL